MQLSLAEYMDEMRQKQDTLNRQNARLQEAYSEAQEYEKMKDKFLHDMTSQMTVPVDTVCRNTYSICADYQTMSKAEEDHPIHPAAALAPFGTADRTHHHSGVLTALRLPVLSLQILRQTGCH